MTSVARRFLAPWVGLALVLLGATVPGRASASGPIVVTTTANENNNDGDCSLREAISSANTDSRYDACKPGSGADTILLSKGQFKLDTRLTISHPLTIVGSGRFSTVIDAEQSDRVLSMGHTDLTLERLRITGGKASSDGGGSATTWYPDSRINVRHGSASTKTTASARRPSRRRYPDRRSR